MIFWWFFDDFLMILMIFLMIWDWLIVVVVMRAGIEERKSLKSVSVLKNEAQLKTLHSKKGRNRYESLSKAIISQYARLFTKVQAKKLVKWNESISQNFVWIFPFSERKILILWKIFVKLIYLISQIFWPRPF